MKKIKISRLEIIVFTSGTIVMILELVGSRIFAPYLGTSIFVWSSLIGIILGALSLGYYLGGKLSKDNPRLYFLSYLFSAASLLILALIIVREPILEFSMTMGVKMGSIFATIILFTPPSIILGMISPYVIRLKVKSVESSGATAGNLYAISTIGSIFGTFMAGFYLIPNFTSTQILIGLSIALVVLAVISAKKLKNKLIFSFLVTFIIPASFISGNENFLMETDSAYNHITVREYFHEKTQRNIRIMFLGTEAHSIIFTDSDEVFSIYAKLYRLDSLFGENFKKGLTLGGGAYITPKDFLARYPDSKMTVVEIDPEVTETARKFFNFEDDQRLDIRHEDARIFLNNNEEKFGVIYGDAFSSYYSIPFHLTTKEAIKKIYDSLTDDGIFVLNVISSLEGEKSLFFKAEYKTISQYFPQIYLFPSSYHGEQDIEKPQNIVLIATKSAERLSRQDLEKNASPKQLELLEYFFEKEIIINEKIPILTDEFAPVDYYASKFLK